MESRSTPSLEPGSRPFSSGISCWLYECPYSVNDPILPRAVILFPLGTDELDLLLSGCDQPCSELSP